MFDDASRRVRKRDKYGSIWDVYQIDDQTTFSLYARQLSEGVQGQALVKTHEVMRIRLDAQEETVLQKLPVAFLGDVRVEEQFENRGVGSMLVEEVLAECKRRGHRGIEGSLSEVDRDHFGKLEYFYKKLGFSVVFYKCDDPEYNELGPGKVELRF